MKLSDLPALKQPLEGGIFCGLTTTPDGTHCAVVRLDAKPDKRLTWQQAQDWAKEAGGQAPSRSVAALMYAVAKDAFERNLYWTNEPEGSSYAWSCNFNDGNQFYDSRSFKGCAVAVRLIPLSS